MNNLDLNIGDDWDWYFQMVETWDSKGHYYYRKTDYGFEIFFDTHQYEVDKLLEENET